MVLVADKAGCHAYDGSGSFIKSIRPKSGGTIYGIGNRFICSHVRVKWKNYNLPMTHSIIYLYFWIGLVPARVDRGTIVLVVETKDKDYVFEHWDKELNRVSYILQTDFFISNRLFSARTVTVLIFLPVKNLQSDSLLDSETQYYFPIWTKSIKAYGIAIFMENNEKKLAHM